MPASELLRQPQYAHKYAQWDEQGKPTTDAAGEKLTKSAAKEVEKLYKKQGEANAKLEAQRQKNPGLFEQLRADVDARRAEVQQLVARLEAEGGDALLSEELLAQLKEQLGGK